MFRKLTILAVLGGMTALNASARADEAATIRNDSLHAVPFVLRWTNLTYDSPLIVLAPGQSYTTRSGDGNALFIRFNANPTNSQFPRWVNSRVFTRFAGPGDGGTLSVFRSPTAYDVELFLP
ncbi:MAG: hypothetical protein U0835_23815 [Isosphaeraceae bacterium]